MSVCPIAIHEAGHCTIALHLGLPIKGAALLKDKCKKGVTIVPEPDLDWGTPDKVIPDPAWHWLAYSMGGFAAETYAKQTGKIPEDTRTGARADVESVFGPLMMTGRDFDASVELIGCATQAAHEIICKQIDLLLAITEQLESQGIVKAAELRAFFLAHPSTG